MTADMLNKEHVLPLVSIIVPIFNVDEYLEKCLESLVNQTYTNLDIILVNDGSTDCTLRPLEEFRDPTSTV